MNSRTIRRTGWMGTQKQETIECDICHQQVKEVILYTYECDCCGRAPIETCENCSKLNPLKLTIISESLIHKSVSLS